MLLNLRKHGLIISCMQKKVSLKDIAEKVGVSVTLVSYVLNNRMEGRINKEVAKKIRDTAARLNYQPNQLARSLKTRRSHTIGLVVSDIANPFSSSLARLLEDEADQQGYTVIFGSSDENPARFQKLVNTLVNRQVDGLILSPPADALPFLHELKKKKIPFVLFDRYFAGLSATHVALDNYAGAFAATQHLINTGRKRIGLVNYDSELLHLQQRTLGYQDALQKAGIKPLASWIQLVARHQPGAVDAAIDQLLRKPAAVDALLLANNDITTAALKHINQLPLRVPDHLSLISFDYTPQLDLFYAPLSYIKQPVPEMARLAFHYLLEQVSSGKTHKSILMPPELVLRTSTGTRH